MKTYSAKPKDLKPVWYIVDAGDATLGRLSVKVAELLMGKGKPLYTQHINCGDYVIVINAEKLRVSGKKMEDKKYYRHSGYPGNLRETSMKHELEKNPAKIIKQSIRGMLPVNKLRDDRLSRLKIYAGEEHEHQAQKPIVMNISPTRESRNS